MRVNLVQAKGGQGTSVVAAALAVTWADQGRRVRLDGHDRNQLAAVLGFPGDGDGPVTANLYLGPDLGPDSNFEVVVHDGPSDRGTTLLVTRCCYLALRRAVKTSYGANGVIVVEEPGRALGADDCADVIGWPVVAVVPVRAEIARAVDAGIFATRVPPILTQAMTAVIDHVSAMATH